MYTWMIPNNICVVVSREAKKCGMMINHMTSKVRDEITYPFPNLNGRSLGMDKSFHPTLYNGLNYIFHAGNEAKPCQ